MVARQRYLPAWISRPPQHPCLAWPGSRVYNGPGFSVGEGPMPPVRFILNADDMSTNMPAGMTVLDFVRNARRLCGTKIGCREGDCGACTVLVGTPLDAVSGAGDAARIDIDYRTMTSCLLALANVHGKHVVTIEGLNLSDRLNPAQE